MKKIIVAYWIKRIIELPYEHNQVFEYSEKTRNEIINVILEHDYSVMLRPLKTGDLMIWIDKGRFGQR